MSTVISTDSTRPGVRRALGRALGLAPYSDALEQRLTARQFASVEWIRATGVRGRFLDIGSGPGWLEYLLKDDGVELLGIDPSGKALQIARSNSPHAAFVAGSALEIPFASASFDGAAMFEVIEHVPKGTERTALREARRVLREGAPFFLSTPYADRRAMLLDPAWYFGHRHYPERALRALLEEVGFRVERVAVLGGAWELATMWLLYLCKWSLDSEVPVQRHLESKRQNEFRSGRRGFTNIFVVARAV